MAITITHGLGNSVTRPGTFSTIRALLQDVANVLHFGPLDQLSVTQDGSEVTLEDEAIDGATINVANRAGRKGN